MFSTFFKLTTYLSCLVALIVIVIYFLPSILDLLSFIGKTNTKLVSPITDSSKLGSNLWFPMDISASGIQDGPQISAGAAYFVDAQTGQILYQKNPHQKLQVASLTKIMTVIVTLSNRDLDSQIKISQHAASMDPDKMELIAGEQLSVEELLDGIFLVSANDAAEALADSYVQGRDQFIGEMNIKSHELGMNDSLFINPTGLEEDGKDQYSSAYDVALMSRYAVNQFPHLLDISSQPHIFLSQTSTHQDYDLYSGINLLTTYPGVVGFKTGYTPSAGLTLVTVAKREGHTILGVLLASEDRRGEARELLDYSFKKLGVI